MYRSNRSRPTSSTHSRTVLAETTSCPCCASSSVMRLQVSSCGSAQSTRLRGCDIGGTPYGLLSGCVCGRKGRASEAETILRPHPQFCPGRTLTRLGGLKTEDIKPQSDETVNLISLETINFNRRAEVLIFVRR